MQLFREYTQKAGQQLEKGTLQCLQVNMGYRCNLQCSHCHMEAGPERKEIMDISVMEGILGFAKKAAIKIVDITGGAPEMNPFLRDFIKSIKLIPSVERVLLRTNLAIFEEQGYCDLPEFFAEQGVELVASMPCYLQENVEIQRGKGVYPKNIRILQKLNLLGYGSGTAGLNLHLVYNPGGAYLPGPQQELETSYREHLQNTFGIVFNSLFTITNMPIGRFRDQLEKQGLLENYQKLLVGSYNPDNIEKIMCRDLISVDWQGRVYDCDFNQALCLPSAVGVKRIGEIEAQDIVGKPIATGNHCFACVAGSGSSCQGSLEDKTAG